MAPEFCAWRSFCINLSANLIEQDKFVGAQSLARRSNIRSDKASAKALISLQTFIPPLVLPSIKDFFTKYLKVFIELTQAQA